MRSTWRWFGPKDIVPIEWMLQAGVEGVVTALHHIPTGTAWTRDAIQQRQTEVATRSDGTPSGLKWEVVESLPVSEAIKTQSGDWRADIANWRASLEAIAAQGIEVVCYNFMPVLDWTRTDLAYRLPHGGTAMRFDAIDFAVFDIHVLKRDGASDGIDQSILDQAASRFAAMSDADCTALYERLVCGLPGAADGISRENFVEVLATYNGITPQLLRQHQIDFLEQVVPDAERLGLRLCCHPDDPPFPLLGLPRIMSTEADYTAMVEAVPSPANGITFCSGSLGPRVDNDLPGMMNRLGKHVHFLHLRNTSRDSDTLGASFHEAEHLGGDTNMPALITAILTEETRRKAEGRDDWNIPFRPDHGQDILDDLKRSTQPGYPAIGRLRGLAELHGVIAGLKYKA